MKLLRAGLAMLFLALAAPAFAASVPLLSGPFDPGQGQANFNNLIIQLNAILSPLVVGTGVNQVGLTSAATGAVATISLQSAADANASIGLSPKGNGNIVLWSGDTAGTGVLQFANAAGFVAAPGLTSCPGTVSGQPFRLGLSTTVTGFIVVQDWLGRSHGLPAC